MGDLSNKEKKNVKIRVFFLKLSWNKGIACTKIREKNDKNLKKKN